MKAICVLSALAVTLAAGGCGSYRQEAMDRSQQNETFVRTINDAQVNAAVVRQRTIFPYHFVPYSAELTELGERDLRVLAAYFLQHPGQLNIRRGDADEALYAARIEATMAELELDGVDRNRLQVADELAGGDGIISVAIVHQMNRSSQDSQDAIPLAEARGSSNGGSSRSDGGSSSSGEDR